MIKDPYVYEETNVLKNISNIKDQTKLDDYETTMVNLGIIKLLKSEFKINKVEDIFIIHKVLFENVYEWAGEKRIINISKSEPILNGLSVIYTDVSDIENELIKVQNKIDNIKWNLLSENEIIKQTVIVISRIWQVHSFREGNTRVVTLFSYYFLKHLGLVINRDFINRHAKYFRNALVLASIGKYSEYSHLEKILKDSIDFYGTGELEQSNYKTINGYDLDKYQYNYHQLNYKKIVNEFSE